MTENLLRIDVKAEIRKLTRQRFKSVGDYAVELVKYIASQKPLLINIESNSRHLRIRHDGDEMSVDTLKRLITVFDSTRPSRQRHNALVGLEEAEGLGLLAAFSPASARVSIAGQIGGRQLGIEFTPSGQAMSFDANGQDDFCITVKGRGRRPSLERKLLKQACRFSLVPIRLNGQRINHGPQLEGCLTHVDLRNARLHGTVGLPEASDLSQIVRLKNGIRIEEKIRPAVNGMIFHSVIDEKDDDIDASWATLRRVARRLYLRLV